MRKIQLNLDVDYVQELYLLVLAKYENDQEERPYDFSRAEFFRDLALILENQLNEGEK